VSFNKPPFSLFNLAISCFKLMTLLVWVVLGTVLSLSFTLCINRNNKR
jgi:hypothetical protein